MKTSLLGCLGCSLALLLFAPPSRASSTACGMQMQPLDCREIPSDYAWAPSSQPTIGLGCLGYPTPAPMTDAGITLTPKPNYFLPTVSSAKFTIEVDGQTLTGGTFSDAEITCREDCKLDGGWANCPMQALVRYSGPLIPGREHKVIWTNQRNPYTDEPATVLFMVSKASSVSTGQATVSTGQATSCSCALGTRAPSSPAPLLLMAMFGLRRRVLRLPSFTLIRPLRFAFALIVALSLGCHGSSRVWPRL